MKKKAKCPLCGHPMRWMPSTFELRGFIYRSSERKGTVGVSVTPKGLLVESCYTLGGCGETFFDMKTAKAMDAATERMHKKHPELIPLLEKIQKETRVKRKT